MNEQVKLIYCDRGHPLALKIIATSIQVLFEGNAEFLEQETTVFNGIRRLLDQQFQYLSKLEKQIMVCPLEPLQPKLREVFTRKSSNK